MSNIWDSEIDISLDEAKERISEQFPYLQPIRIKESGEGWDNKVFLVNEAVIFRFPRRKIAVALIEREGRWLPRLARLLHKETPISAPTYIGKPSSRFPYPFIGYPLIKGRSANELEIQLDEREGLIEDIALFLKRLHHIQVAPFEGLVGDELNRLDVDAKKNEIIQRLKWLEEQAIIDTMTPYLEVIKAAHNIGATKRDTLVHGDFYFRNFLINNDCRLAGVIDFGDLHRGHPAVDLSVAYTFFPADMRIRFFSYYGEIDTETEALARFRGLHVMCYLLVYGFNKQDEGIMREAKTGLVNLISNHS